MPLRKGLPKLEDFVGQRQYGMLEFWDFYDEQSAFGGNLRDPVNLNLANWNNVRNTNTEEEAAEVFGDGHGIYIISDARLTANSPRHRRGNPKTPIENVIYVGQAGAESEGENSNFHDRIYKHALVAVGIHDKGWGEEPVRRDDSMQDSEYWLDYREHHRNADWERGQLPIDDWWISLITMPSESSEDKITIKRLEDLLMLGVSALNRTDIENHQHVFSKTLPFCNKQFSFGLLSKVYKHPWKTYTGRKKPS